MIPVLIAGIMIFSYWVSLRYALAYYLLADHPDYGAFAAVRRSVELTRGWKWEMFKLAFSFIGWELLDLLLYSLALLLVLVQGGFFQSLSLEHYGDAYMVYQIILSLSPLRPSSPAGLHPGKAVALSLPLRDHGRLLRRPAAPPAGGFCGDAPSLNIQSYPPGPLGPGVFLEASLVLEHSFDIRTNV